MLLGDLRFYSVHRQYRNEIRWSFSLKRLQVKVIAISLFSQSTIWTWCIKISCDYPWFLNFVTTTEQIQTWNTSAYFQSELDLKYFYSLFTGQFRLDVTKSVMVIKFCSRSITSSGKVTIFTELSQFSIFMMYKLLVVIHHDVSTSSLPLNLPFPNY